MSAQPAQANPEQANATIQAYRTILTNLLARNKLVVIEPSDSPEEVQAKLELHGSNQEKLDETIQKMLALLESIFEAQHQFNAIPIYWGNAEPTESGLPRVRIRKGGQYFEAPVQKTCEISEARLGQELRLDTEGVRVIGIIEQRPHAPEIMQAIEEPHQVDDRWEVEVRGKHGEGGGVIVLSGWIDPADIEPPCRVAVRDGVVYRVLEDSPDQKHFLLETEIKEIHPESRVDLYQDVIGQDDAVELLELELHRLMGAELPGMSVAPPGGAFALIGPPGHGKTMAAKGVITMAKDVMGDDVLIFWPAASSPKSMWYGQSGANVREIFDFAKRLHRETGCVVIIIIDEAEPLISRRGNRHDSTGADADITSELLSAIDGVKPLIGVLVILCINNPQLMDEALKRPGRFGGANFIMVNHLDPSYLQPILENLLVRLEEGVLSEESLDPYLEAGKAAVESQYGEVMFKEGLRPLLGRHLFSGAAVSDGLKAAVKRLQRHLMVVEQNGGMGPSPFQKITPAMLYHGLRQTFEGVLESLAGENNLYHAQGYFSGNMYPPREAKMLKEVSVLEVAAPTPDAYSLEGMESLEREARRRRRNRHLAAK